METNLAETPESAESAQVETTKVDSEVVETEGAESAPAAADTGKPATRDRVQERIDQLTREKYEALGGRDTERYRREQLEREIAELRQQQTAKPQAVAPSDEFPTLESVDFDEGKLRQAIAAYYERTAEKQAEAVLARREEARQREQRETDWQRKQSDFIKSKPEYAEKVGSLPPYLMTDAVAEEIKESGNPEVALYLAENVEKLAEIARLPQKAIAREIGRIEARLEAAKAKPVVSKAPPPPAKIPSADSSSALDPTDPESDNVSADKWLKARIKQVKKINQR